MSLAGIIVKPHFVFVGAFPQPGSESISGGQLHACTTLLRSPIRDGIEWTLINSTLETFPAPPLIYRVKPALKRLWKFCSVIGKRSMAGALIFAADGPSFLEKGAMALVAHWLGRRVVFSPRSGISIDDSRNSILMRSFMRFVLRRCDVVMCQSESWKAFYQSLASLPEGRIVVVQNWMELDPSTTPRAPMHVDSPLKVLFLGWVERNKGIFDLVEVARRNREELKGVRFVVCGRGQDMEAVLAQVRRDQLESMFDFRGWVAGDEKAKALKEADIFMLLSYREGFPNALLEAMAAGCAVVAAGVGAVPELVDDGQNGLLIQPGNMEAISKALLSLCQSPARRIALGNAAQARVQAHHNIAMVWPRVYSLLNPAQR